MQKKTLALVLICCLCIGAGLAGVWFFQKTTPGDRDEIVVGTLLDESSALLIIADEKGYFATNGLNVTLVPYPNGAAAIEDLKKGNIDIAGCTEYPIAAEALKHETFLVFGSIDKYYGTYLVARKDHLVAETGDLRGKQIAIPGQTIAEFYLARFLSLHNVTTQDVTVLRKLPAQSVPEFNRNETIDAIMVRRIIFETQINRTNGSFVVWPVQSDRPTYTVLIADRDWYRSRPDRDTRFLQSLAMAETYVAVHPAESQAILRKKLNVTDSYLTGAWQDNQFALTLDQSFLIATEDEVRWMIRSNLSETKTMPNLLEFIDTSSMEQVKPGSTNIIHGT